jgi:hypothetical protein
MLEPPATSPGITLTLTAEERQHLLSFLEQSFRTTLVEEHRTDAFEFREYVKNKEAILKSLIDKLQG